MMKNGQHIAQNWDERARMKEMRRAPFTPCVARGSLLEAVQQPRKRFRWRMGPWILRHCVFTRPTIGGRLSGEPNVTHALQPVVVDAATGHKTGKRIVRHSNNAAINFLKNNYFASGLCEEKRRREQLKQDLRSSLNTRP
jgi:hypothetical protein